MLNPLLENLPARPRCTRQKDRTRVPRPLYRHFRFPPLLPGLPAGRLFSALLILAAFGVAEAGQLRFTSQPEKATVTINGRFAGVTPFTLEELPRGKYLLAATRRGRHRWRKILSWNGRSRNIHIELPAGNMAVLTVTSQPAGALAFLDGACAGETPLKTVTRPGPHVLLIEKDDYVPLKKTINLVEGKNILQPWRMVSTTEALAREEIRLHPEQVVNYTDLGHSLLLSARVEDALEVFAAGMDASVLDGAKMNDVYRLYQEIEKIYRGQFKFGDANAVESLRPRLEKMLRAASHRKPGGKYNYRILGKLLEQRKDYKGAAEIYSEGAKKARSARGRLLLATLASGALYSRAIALETAGKLDEAIRIYRACAAAFPKSYHSANALVRVAEIYRVRLKDYVKAATAIADFIRRFPENDAVPGQLIELGDLKAAHLGDGKGAIENYRELVKRFPENDRSPTQLVKIINLCEQKLKNNRRAVQACDSFLKNYPDHDRSAWVLAKLMRLYQTSGAKEKAEVALEKLLNHFPASPEAEALERDPTRRARIAAAAAAWKQIRTISSSQKKQAVPMLERFVTKYRRTSYARMAQLELVGLFEPKDRERAIAARRRFLELFPKDDRCPPLRLAIAESCRKMGRFKEAAAEFEHFLMDYPADDRGASVLQTLAAMFHYGLHFNRQAVIRYNRLLMKRFPDRDANANAQLSIARSFLYSQMFPEAEKEYWKVIRQYPFTPAAVKADFRLDWHAAEP